MSITFKIFFGNNNIRRFNTPKQPTYEEFVALLVKLYSPVYHPELRLQYVDTEKDHIDVTCQLEWEEMFVELAKERIIKLYVKEGSGVYFKDSPQPQPVFFYTDLLSKKPFPVEEKELCHRVPECLAKFFPNGKILPHNLPSFLSEIVTIKNLENNEVEIDVDILKLNNVLHKNALDSLDKKEYSKGLEYLEAQAVLNPNNYITLYNLACAHSLLNNFDDALYLLNRAIDLGYRDVNYILEDEDFNNIKHTEGFARIIEKLKKGEPEYVPEPFCYHNYVKPFESEPPLSHEIKPEIKSEIQSEPKLETPETKPENEKSADIPVKPLKWEAQLNQLEEMGFLVHSELIPLLDKNNGNVQETVLSLLSNNY